MKNLHKTLYCILILAKTTKMTSVAMEKQNQVQLKIVEVFGCARQEGNRKKTKIEKKSIETTF